MSLAEQLRTFLDNMYEHIFKNQGLRDLFVSLTMILFWVILAYLITRAVKFLLFKTRSFGKKIDKKETKEQQTIKRLVNNVIRFFFVFWIAIMILNELGLDLMPILAGAGVLAFAVGFGAQELIKDVISGMFLIIEKTFKIGDYVEIGDFSGTIIDVGLRRVKLQNWKGEVITLNNGDIKSVKNLSINPSYAVIDFKVNYNFNLEELKSEEFKQFLIDFKENTPNVLEMPSSLPVVDLSDGIKFTTSIKTETRKHIAVERAFREQLLKYFNRKNIDIKIPIKIISEEK